MAPSWKTESIVRLLKDSVYSANNQREGANMKTIDCVEVIQEQKIVTLSIDLAKSVFQICSAGRSTTDETPESHCITRNTVIPETKVLMKACQRFLMLIYQIMKSGIGKF